MATLFEDIKKQADWTVKAFKSDGLELDYSMGSLIEIDRFIHKYTKDGHPIKGRRLSKNLGGTVFSISAYIGETLIKNVPNSKWTTNDNDPHGEINIAVELGNGTTCFPAQRLIKRIQNGLEDGIYPYGVSVSNKKADEKYDGAFWRIEKEVQPMEPKKPWWKF
jgi:phosphomannomutase